MESLKLSDIMFVLNQVQKQLFELQTDNKKLLDKIDELEKQNKELKIKIERLQIEATIARNLIILRRS